MTAATTTRRPLVAADMRAADRLQQRAEQLNALLSSVAGEGFEPFSRLNDELQQNLLWLAADLAKDVRDLSHKVLSAPTRS